ncbi:MAG: nuclear transport factor 2 family protein [Candidatus Dadabacteria bacterium]
MTRIFTVLTIFLSSTVFAQNSTDSIKATIMHLFDGMRTTDTALIRSAFVYNPVFQSVITNKEGRVVVRSESLDSFIVSIAKPHNLVYDERIIFDDIRMDGDLAMVWAPYKFYLGDKFSHCGVDSFQLVRIDGVWKILYLVDTRRRDCE